MKFSLFLIAFLSIQSAFSHTADDPSFRMSTTKAIEVTNKKIEIMGALKQDASVAMKKFDVELALGTLNGNIWDSQNYRRLLAIRSLYEQNMDEYLAIYDSNPEARPAMVEILKENYSLKSSKFLSVAADMLDELFPFDEHNYTTQQVSNSTDIGQNHPLNTEITFLAASIRGQVNPPSNKSLANNTTIEPSVNRNGNIVGTEFPAKVWSITYDDGPHGTRTQAMLQMLRENNVYATFFELAGQVKSMPQISMAVLNDGHEMANHSYNHPNLIQLGIEALTFQITQSTKEETKLWGIAPRFFRCPYGSGVYNPAIRKLIADNNMIHAFWTVDSLDWNDRNPESIFNRSKLQIDQNGRGIVLFHDIHQQTITASQLVINYLKKKEARLMTLSEAVDETNSAE